MHRYHTACVLLGLLAARSHAQPAATQTPAISTAITQSPTIVVAELDHVGTAECGGQRSSECNIPIRAHIVRVLKNAAAMRLGQQPFEAQLPVYVGDTTGDEGSIWTNRPDIRDGQQYVFVARTAATVADVVRAPYDLEPLTRESDPVADVELILGPSLLDVAQQAQMLAATISAPPAPHSRLLARHVVELLRAGKEQDVIPLAQALQLAPERAFSDNARAALLYDLRGAAIREKRESLGHLLVSLAMQYFLADPGPAHADPERRTQLSEAQAEVLWNVVPWIAKSEDPEALLATSVSPSVLKQMKVRLLSLEGGRGGWAGFGEPMNQLIALVGAR
jgi:hypothetical protein